MIDVFGYVKDLLKVDPVCVDNIVFRLHYKVTVIVLVSFSLIVTARQYVGNPINCTSDYSVYNIIDTYCWIHSTFTLANRAVSSQAGINFAHPGVASPADSNDHVNNKYHKYYQWVCFVLFFQAVLFYAPKYVWKTLENGRVKALMTDLQTPVVNDERASQRKKILVEYFARNLHRHGAYAAQFFACELLNLVNAIVQVYLVNYFLDGEFITYGLDVLLFDHVDPESRDDPMARIFPKVTKCAFRTYGPSGTIQEHDALCVLPLNVVNEKIYVFMWFWLLFIAVVSGLGLVYRVAIVCSRCFRAFRLRSRSPLSPSYELKVIKHKFHLGDWFMLYQLSKNIDPLVFRELVSDLSRMFDKNSNAELL